MQIGRYEVLRSLGEGGSAKVLLGRSLATSQHVVLKVPLKTAPDQLERLRDEARVGLRLQHPGVVETLDLFEHEGKPILVVEFLDGASLQQIRRVGPLAPAAVVRVGRQIAEALDAIHSATDETGASLNILHRDVTPANILVTRSGDAKLIDLGIARSAETQARATQSGAVRGTLRYLAPELIEGQKHSAATDLWALGVVLWEAVLGRRAIVGDDREILTAILRGEVMKYQSGEALDPRLHDALAAFIAPAAQRIQRAKAAANILSRLEAAFGDGQAPAQAAVDMAVRLAPDDESIDVGDTTRQVLSAAPNPVTMPPSAPVAGEPGRKQAALDDDVDEAAATVQMQAVDIPTPSAPHRRQTDKQLPGATTPSPPAAPSSVAPVAAGDLNDPLAGRYAKTEQAMPAVTLQADPSAIAPMPSTDPATSPPGMSPPLVASTSGPPVGQQPNTAVKGLSVNEETEAAFDSPFDETVERDAVGNPIEPAARVDNIKSTQLLHGGSGLPSLEAQTVQNMPAIDATALEPQGPPSTMAPAPANPEPPAEPLSRGPLPPPSAQMPSPHQGPTGTALNMPAPDVGARNLPGPPVATAPPSGDALPTTPARSKGPSIPNSSDAGRTVPAPSKPPAPAASTPPAAAPLPSAPRPDPASPAGQLAPKVTVPQGTPGLASTTAEGGPPDVTAEQPPSTEDAAPPAASAPMAAAPPAAPAPAANAGPPSGGQQPFQMTVTQAFFAKDIKDAIVAEASAEGGPQTVEMQAAIAPVESKIALLVAGLVILGVLLVGGPIWLFGGGDDDSGATGAQIAAADAGVEADAGPPEDEAKKKAAAAEKADKAKADKKPKKRKRRRSKRRR